MKRVDHLMADKVILGKKFNEVHAWIDSKFPEYRGFEHWKHYHHLEAIKNKYTLGTEEYTSAVLHVVIDFVSHLQEVFMPKNEQELIAYFEKGGIYFKEKI